MKLHDYKGYIEHINEIEIKPIKTPYTARKIPSKYYKNKFDYTLEFTSNNTTWVVYLLCFIINGVETYNIVFTSQIQWVKYRNKHSKLFSKYGNNIPKDEHEKLSKIIDTRTVKTNMNSLFKNMTYVILDFCQNMTIDTFSIGYTSDERKICYYRNIIKYSFINYTESEVIDKNDGETYFIYKV